MPALLVPSVLRVLALVLALGPLAGCGPGGAHALRGAAAAPRPTERLHALLVNGGSRKALNYRSHLQNVEGVLAELRASGVPPERIVVFSSDGDAPKADLAIRDTAESADAWLVPDPIERALRPIQFVDSRIDGVVLRPAKKAALQEWFAGAGAALAAGDTLLLYVTDHGEKNAKDTSNNTISLWHEELSVAELRALLDRLDPGVRVVMVMSQCYGGSFAHAIYPTPEADLPGGGVCGYFASTADRPAYGCYPENRGKDGVGHSFRLLRALASLGTLEEAHRRVLVTDRTPDVPHRTTDFFFGRLVAARAEAAGRAPDAFTDALLARAWKDRGAWEPELRLLDRIGNTFGTFSPRSLAELDAQSARLPDFSAQLDTYADRWREALAELKNENFRRFLEAHPEWSERFSKASLEGLDAAALRALGDEFLAVLVPFARASPERWARLESLKQKADAAAAARYRAEVRLGAVLRMRMLLGAVAGRTYLAEEGTAAEREAFARLDACEDVTLDPTPAVATAAELESPEPYPPLAEERLVVERVTPAWLGLRYRPLTAAENDRLGTSTGAVKVVTTWKEHPASRSLQVGDVVLGPPDDPFTEPHELREWTMRGEIGVPTRLAILREGARREVTLRLAPFPLEVPPLPGPPRVGSAAPGVDVDLVRGQELVARGKPRLLVFWATWCLICKQAMPEVLAFARARGVEVIAITDEEPATLETFFASYDEPFPAIVASDLDRVTFLDYGVSGVPTMVLLDEAGIVRHYQAGYSLRSGLGVEGWTWAGRPAPAGG